jgi:8-oxo-dGTP pyrophosphatase MutT (NUDIX family)
VNQPRAPIPSATILMVRDAPDLEVLMVVRHHQIDFASGALVFPGGKLAPDDAAPEWRMLADGAEGLSEMEISLRVGAIREAFEESGLILARPGAQRGAGAPLAGCAAAQAIAVHRDAVARGELAFSRVIADAGLALALDTLVDYAHWITPAIMPKRFDTYFLPRLRRISLPAMTGARRSMRPGCVRAQCFRRCGQAREKSFFPPGSTLSVWAKACLWPRRLRRRARALMSSSSLSW